MGNFPTFWEFSALPLLMVVLIIVVVVCLVLATRELVAIFVKRDNAKRALRLSNSEHRKSATLKANEAYYNMLQRYDRKHTDFYKFAKDGVQDVDRKQIAKDRDHRLSLLYGTQISSES